MILQLLIWLSFLDIGYSYIYIPNKSLCSSLNQIKKITEKINNEEFNLYENKEIYITTMNNNLIKLFNSCKIYGNIKYTDDFCVPSINKLVINEYLKNFDISLATLTEYFKLKTFLIEYSTKYLAIEKCVKIQNIIENFIKINKNKDDTSFLFLITIILISFFFKSPGFFIGNIIGIFMNI